MTTAPTTTPALDRTVAELLGLITVDENGQWTRTEAGRAVFAVDYPAFSTDLNAAITLTDDMPQFRLIKTGDTWAAWVTTPKTESWHGHAATPALAIVLAWLNWKQASE
jgi:hypothetical protein